MKPKSGAIALTKDLSLEKGMLVEPGEEIDGVALDGVHPRKPPGPASLDVVPVVDGDALPGGVCTCDECFERAAGARDSSGSFGGVDRGYSP